MASDFAARQMLDRLFLLRVALTHDLIEFHCLHAGIPELREDAAGFDRFVLATNSWYQTRQASRRHGLSRESEKNKSNRHRHSWTLD